MKVIKGVEGLKGQFEGPVVTIGNFDGVHLGHRKILRQVIEAAGQVKGEAVALTFDPHPIKVLYPERNVRLLTPLTEKARLMSHFGMDALCVIKFDREFAGAHPDDFIKEVLVQRLRAKMVVVGHNYAFGKGKKGNTALLRRRGKKYGFTVKVVRNARVYGDVVSSSRIRSLVGRGRVCEASLFLGRPYMISGTVVKGAGRGASILGVPTANIDTRNELIPKEGVYAVKVRLIGGTGGRGGKLYGGVANIGRNPTFGEGLAPSYEVHILDFSENILGDGLEVFFIDRIRDEKTFSDKGSLAIQIKKDIERGREILGRKQHPPVI